MSTTNLTASLNKQITALLTGSGYPAASAPSWSLNLPKFNAAAFTYGTGADKIQYAYAAQFNLAASGSLVIDLYDLALNGGADGVDPLGGAYALANVKYLGILSQGNALYYSLSSAVIGTGGTGGNYVVGDILTVNGGTFSTPATVKVQTIAGSSGSQTVATVVVLNPGIYSAAPGLTGASTSGGSGTGCTLNLTMPSATLTDAQLAAGVAVFTGADFLTIGANGTTPWTKFLGGTTPTLKLGSGTFNAPGTFELLDGSGSLYTVVDASNNLLKILNSGSNNMTFVVIILGA